MKITTITEKTENIQTVQLTSKNLKAWWLLSVVIMVTSLFVLVVFRNDSYTTINSLLFFLFGAITYIITKIRIWWNHS